MRLLIFGLDGCSDRLYWDPELAMPYITGELIPRCACFGTTISHVNTNREGRTDPHTGPNWASIYTGVDPAVHGIGYGGWLHKHMSHGSLKTRSIWFTIRDSYSLGLIGMPITYPAFECEWMVSGFPNSEVTKHSVFPSHMYKGLAKSGFMVDYGDGHTQWRDKLSKNWDKEKDVLLRIEAEKVELAKKMHAVSDVEVLAFGTTAIDKVCHLFGLFSDQTLLVYKKIDKIMRRMVEHFSPDQVMVVADHGFGAFGKRHNERGFFCWFDRDLKGNKPEQIEVSINSVAPMILDALGIQHDEIGKSVLPKDFKQDEAEAIEHRFRQLGYM